MSDTNNSSEHSDWDFGWRPDWDTDWDSDWDSDWNSDWDSNNNNDLYILISIIAGSISIIIFTCICIGCCIVRRRRRNPKFTGNIIYNFI